LSHDIGEQTKNVQRTSCDSVIPTATNATAVPHVCHVPCFLENSFISASKQLPQENNCPGAIAALARNKNVKYAKCVNLRGWFHMLRALLKIQSNTSCPPCALSAQSHSYPIHTRASGAEGLADGEARGGLADHAACGVTFKQPIYY
jgi:hypothetical protein